MKYVYYHRADLDGLCCGALAYRHFGLDAVYCGVDYGDTLNFDPKAELNLFLDFSPPPPVPENLFVIDHHITSQGLPGIIDTTQAACVLAWRYFQSTSVPVAVELIAAADMYNNKRPNWLTEVVPFVLAVDARAPSICDPMWDLLFNGTHDHHALLVEGGAIKRYKDNLNNKLCREQAYTTYFHGEPVLVIMGGDRGSARLWAGFGYGYHAFMVVIQNIKNEYWRYHLYSPQDGGVDVEQIAKQHGGGGHKHAAGFISPDRLV